MRVTLAHHWTDPDTGKNHLPGSSISVTEQQAKGLAAGGYLESTSDSDATSSTSSRPRRARAAKRPKKTTTAAPVKPDDDGSATA